MPNNSPPTNDPSLPSFWHPFYARAMPHLTLAKDIWDDLEGCVRKYLPKGSGEPPEAYIERLGRTQFDNRFTPTVKGHAGLLTDFSLNELAKTVELAENDIDLQGTAIAPFLNTLDEMALRDGGVGLLVEYPSVDEEIESAADQISLNHRPYWVPLDCRNMPNSSIKYINGVPSIQHVTLIERPLVPVGDFGVEQKTYYRVLRPGSYQVWELRNNQGTWQKELVSEGTTGLDEVPFVWYSLTDCPIFQPVPPLINICRLNVEHYQKRSSLNEVLWKCNLPVPVRKGAKSIASAIPGQPPIMPKLSIGTNTFVEVPESGDFYFAEPKGTAIAATQEDIAKLEQAIDRLSLSFLNGGEATKTATEIMLDSAQTQSTLKGLARRKESLVQSMLALWVEYTGEDSGGSIQMNESVLQQAISAQDAQVILDAMGLKISDRLGLEMLRDRKWLPGDVDIDKELAIPDIEPVEIAPIEGIQESSFSG